MDAKASHGGVVEIPTGLTVSGGISPDATRQDGIASHTAMVPPHTGVEGYDSVTSPTLPRTTMDETAGPWRVVATLLSPGGFGPVEEAVSYLTESGVYEADLHDYTEWIATGRQGAGPSSREELINPFVWHEATLMDETHGRRQLGPVVVDAAEAIELLVWDGGENLHLGRHLWSNLIPDGDLIDLGEIAARGTTGLDLLVDGDGDWGDVVILHVRRRMDPDPRADTMIHVPLLERLRPDLHDAIVEAVPLILVRGEAFPLYPLPVDPAVELRIQSLDGLLSDPIQVELTRERIRDLRLDMDELLDGKAASTYRLEGRLVWDRSGKPVEGATVELPMAAVSHRQETDEDGKLVFPYLPLGEPTMFLASLGSGEGGKPRGPGEIWLQYDPEKASDPRATNQTQIFTVPEFRWLYLDLDESARTLLAGIGDPIYPIYTLDRYEESEGSWRTVGADEFLVHIDHVAVSIEEDGVYRTLLFLSPLFAIPGEATVFTGDVTSRNTLLERPQFSIEKELVIEVVDGVTGRPLDGCYVMIAGPVRGLPPLRGTSDREGRYPAGPVTVDLVALFVGRDGYIEYERDISSSEVPATGIYTVRLDRASGIPR